MAVAGFVFGRSNAKPAAGFEELVVDYDSEEEWAMAATTGTELTIPLPRLFLRLISLVREQCRLESAGCLLVFWGCLFVCSARTGSLVITVPSKVVWDP